MNDPKTIKNVNDCRVDSIKEQLDRYDRDFKHDNRIELQLCKCCMYLDISDLDVRIDEEWTCISCLDTFEVIIGQIPNMCISCAKKNDVCSLCGSLID